MVSISMCEKGKFSGFLSCENSFLKFVRVIFFSAAAAKYINNICEDQIEALSDANIAKLVAHTHNSLL